MPSEFIWNNYTKIDKATAKSLFIHLCPHKSMISYGIKIYQNNIYQVF